jgi:hypothetical protein
MSALHQNGRSPISCYVVYGPMAEKVASLPPQLASQSTKADTSRRGNRCRHFNNGIFGAAGQENKSALYPYPLVRPVRATRSERNH